MKKLFTLSLALLLHYFYSNANPLNQKLKDNKSFSLTEGANSPSSTGESMRMNLYGFYADSSTFVVDGTFTQYAPDYSNLVDGNDARKMFNPGENISLLRGTTNLIIERRQTFQDADTIFFRMWNMRKKTYQFQFIGRNMNEPGMSGVLEDRYLQTAAPLNLNDTTLINFIINNDTASYAQDRFRIIFKRMPLLVAIPFTFTSVKAYAQNEQINVSWKTVNENKIRNFNIERSADGISFSEMSSVNPSDLSSNSYEWTDHFPTKENNYYRIRSVNSEGSTEYSNVVKVELNSSAGRNTALSTGITVYPNPATAANLNLRMINQVAGKYEIRLINSYGQSVLDQSFTYNGGNHIEKINAAKSIAAGIYHLEIYMPSGERKVINVVF
jgi:hypothetical protein